MEVSIQDMSELQPTDCSIEAEFGLGALFFLRNRIVMKKVKSGPTYVGISVPAHGTSRDVLPMIGGAVILLILTFFGLLVFRALSGKSAGADDQSAKSVSTR